MIGITNLIENGKADVMNGGSSRSASPEENRKIA
jgi:hypothetical protein